MSKKSKKSSAKSKEIKPTWGTPESYFPFKIHLAPPTDEDREYFGSLTPEQRLKWLIMMHRLLMKQFSNNTTKSNQ